jgi:hypothetical protein
MASGGSRRSTTGSISRQCKAPSQLNVRIPGVGPHPDTVSGMLLELQARHVTGLGCTLIVQTLPSGSPCARRGLSHQSRHAQWCACRPDNTGGHRVRTWLRLHPHSVTTKPTALINQTRLGQLHSCKQGRSSCCQRILHRTQESCALSSKDCACV